MRKADVALVKGPGWTQLAEGRVFVACMGWPFGLVDQAPVWRWRHLLTAPSFLLSDSFPRCCIVCVCEGGLIDCKMV